MATVRRDPRGRLYSGPDLFRKPEVQPARSSDAYSSPLVGDSRWRGRKAEPDWGWFEDADDAMARDPAMRIPLRGDVVRASTLADADQLAVAFAIATS